MADITTNQLFFDALIRHQIGLLRLSGSIRNEIYEVLDATETDIVDQINRKIKRGQTLETSADMRRLDVLLRSIRNTRLKSWRGVNEVWVRRLTELALAEPTFVDNALKTVSPVILDTVLPGNDLLRDIVRVRPFEGQTLAGWAQSVAQADIERIEREIRVGMVQGEGSRQIARRIVGTVRQRGTNGVTQIARNQAEAITRTAVNAISNQAKREYYRENEDLLSGEQYVATLDARTTPVCRSLDGNLYPVGEGPIPPLHFNCRSVRVAVLDGAEFSNRPAKPVTQRMLLNEYTASQGLKPVRRRADLPRGNKGQFDRFSRKRIREIVGTVPGKTTYQEWLTSQSTTFQNDVLGPTRGALFRRGGLTLDRFVNRAGDEIPLAELANRERAALVAAGIDPEGF